jgi:hypothetical protein
MIPPAFIHKLQGPNTKKRIALYIEEGLIANAEAIWSEIGNRASEMHLHNPEFDPEYCWELATDWVLYWFYSQSELKDTFLDDHMTG